MTILEWVVGCCKAKSNPQVLPRYIPNYLPALPTAIQGNKLVYPVFLTSIFSSTRHTPRPDYPRTLLSIHLNPSHTRKSHWNVTSKPCALISQNRVNSPSRLTVFCTQPLPYCTVSISLK